MWRCLSAFWVFMASLTVGSPYAGSEAETGNQRYWTDGIYRYQLIEPLAGYFVPRTVYGYDVRLEDVLAAARPMTSRELSRYVHGGPRDELHVTRHFPLFLFQSHTLNLFMWKS